MEGICGSGLGAGLVQCALVMTLGTITVLVVGLVPAHALQRSP